MTITDKQATKFFKRCTQKLNFLCDKLENLLVQLLHQIALFAIRAAAVLASIYAFIGMAQASQSSIGTIR